MLPSLIKLTNCFLYRYSGKEIIFLVNKSDSVRKVASKLFKNGIIKDEKCFINLSRILGMDKSLKYGEFVIKKNYSVTDLVKLLSGNSKYYVSITIPEGFTNKEIIELINSKSDRLSGEISENLKEGYLMPDTYHYTFGESKNSIINTMYSSMDSFLNSAWSSRDHSIDDVINTKDEALILASIVEKEATKEDEKPLIAAVYINRLRKGIRLQADPTVIYEISDGKSNLGRSLTFADLKKGSTHNTYKIKGLPLTPISNPGKTSILAVLHPAKTKDIYFVVSDKLDKSHEFSDSYAEHLQNIRKYKKAKKQNQASNTINGQ